MLPVTRRQKPEITSKGFPVAVLKATEYFKQRKLMKALKN